MCRGYFSSDLRKAYSQGKSLQYRLMQFDPLSAGFYKLNKAIWLFDFVLRSFLHTTGKIDSGVKTSYETLDGCYWDENYIRSGQERAGLHQHFNCVRPTKHPPGLPKGESELRYFTDAIANEVLHQSLLLLRQLWRVLRGPDFWPGVQWEQVGDGRNLDYPILQSDPYEPWEQC